MTKETLAGVMKNAHNESIETLTGGKLKEVPYSGEVELFENAAEVRAAGEWPSDSDVVGFVNQAKKGTKRQALMTAALEAAGIKKPTLEDPRVQYRQVFGALVASGKTEAEARDMANGMLGTSF